MSEGQSQSAPRFCRQCGGVVPEGTSLCPRCGQKWFMDRTEQQGVDLWQKIIEKRAAAGIGDALPAQEQTNFRCPNCMAALKEPVEVCPHCGKSTAKARIVPADRNEIPSSSQDDELKFPEAAKGLAFIKGATRRAEKLKGRKRFRGLYIVIIAAVIIIVAVIGLLLAGRYSLLPISIPPFFSGPAVEQQEPAPVAGETPVISGIQVSELTSSSSTISWTTSTAAWGKVVYGKSDTYGDAATAVFQAISQSIALEGLEPDTAYHFAVLTTDGKGQEISRSDDNVFNTAAADDVRLPLISQIKVIPTDAGAIIQWVTDEPSTSLVLYGPDQSVASSSAIDNRLVKQHSVHIVGLGANSAYFYRVKSADSEGNTATMDPPGTFTTLITVPIGSKVGERAADFTLPIFNSQENVILRDYRGQKILLTFWAVYCAECDRELSLLQAVESKKIPNVKIIAVFLESKPEDIEKTIARYKESYGELTFPVVVDAYKTTAHLYNVEKVPCTFLIDSDMIIRGIEFGGFNVEQIEETLNDL
ncbi:MAG: redoxin domain-containing protein [Dehalococcoidia bacterium]|nr:redoxin domain-containing protein [Dehalococcoidia bacterium]